jgi:hypothetical protein
MHWNLKYQFYGVGQGLFAGDSLGSNVRDPFTRVYDCGSTELQAPKVDAAGNYVRKRSYGLPWSLEAVFPMGSIADQPLQQANGSQAKTN